MTERISKTVDKESFLRFLEGPYYPLAVCILVAAGSISGLEYFLNFINTGLMVSALFLSRTSKPLIVSFCTYIYQISLQNSPCYPNNSNYYFSSWRLPVTLFLGALMAAGVVAFIIRKGILKKLSFRKTPLLLPLTLLSCALLLNGLFSEAWTFKNILFALSHILVYFVFFLLIYYGFGEDDKSEDLAKYFSYVSMLISFVLISEMVNLFITSDTIFVNGSIDKVSVALGWGIWNLVGVCCSVLVPVIFYGMEKNKYPWLYFVSATLIYIFSVLTMSRNALVFSTLSYAACILILCFVGKNKKHMRIIVAIGIAAIAILAFVMRDKIYALLADYFERGFSDNGRYKLWEAAFENFKKAPIFGNGFYGFDVETAVFGPLPKMAHNTVLELLSACGIVGFLAYVFYRVMTVKPFVKRPSLMKTMLGISILVLLGGGMLDNFVFYIYVVLHSMVALAIVFKRSDEEISEISSAREKDRA